MVDEECLLERARCVSPVSFSRAGANALAPSSPIRLAGRCAVVVVGTGVGQVDMAK
jgi:hypothetical protein